MFSNIWQNPVAGNGITDASQMGTMATANLPLGNPSVGVAGTGGAVPSIWDNTQLTNMNAIGDMYQNTMGNPLGSPAPATPDFWSLTNPDAWKAGSMALGGIGALANTYLGFKQLGQAEDQLAFNKEAFWTNYNMQLEDRQLAAERRAIAKG